MVTVSVLVVSSSVGGSLLRQKLLGEGPAKDFALGLASSFVLMTMPRPPFPPRRRRTQPTTTKRRSPSSKRSYCKNSLVSELFPVDDGHGGTANGGAATTAALAPALYRPIQPSQDSSYTTPTAEDSSMMPAPTLHHQRRRGKGTSDSGESDQTDNKLQLLVLSLPPPDECNYRSYGILSSAWRWKDAVLGDGHDYFVPRPQTLRKLNQVLAGQIQRQERLHPRQLQKQRQQHPTDQYKNATVPSQVSVLSNCARFDVFVTAPASVSVSAVRCSVARTILHQIDRYKAEEGNGPFFLSARALWRLGRGGPDDPSRISDPPSPGVAAACGGGHDDDETAIRLLAESFRVRRGPDRVARYVGTVAAGLAHSNRRRRRRRPGHKIHGGRRRSDEASDDEEDDDDEDPPIKEISSTFRPYSSRDAHVLLQLKRTLDVTVGCHLVELFQAAIRAGKDCRNPSVVTEIGPLRP
jgi:hypothetical protein